MLQTVTFQAPAFDAATLYTEVRWNVAAFTTATASWFSVTTALSTGVVAFQYSVDGLVWAQLLDTDGGSVTFSADGDSKLIDLSGINWVRVRVTTLQASVIGVAALHCKTDA